MATPSTSTGAGVPIAAAAAGGGGGLPPKDPMIEVTTALVEKKMLPLTSDLLARYLQLPEGVISIITGYSATLTKKKRITKEEKQWLNDFLSNQRELFAQLSALESGLSDNEFYEVPEGRPLIQFNEPRNQVRSLDKNRLFFCPETFTGDNKKARALIRGRGRGRGGYRGRGRGYRSNGPIQAAA